MAYKPLLYLILWTTTSTLATAATLNLSSDITSFIPSCALDCFESFVDANFSPDLCGTSPSLQCLCAQDGSQGFTMGEGAVQCIVAENSRGACQGDGNGSQVVQNAYDMCEGQVNAVSPTHSTIVATLLVPTGTGPIVVATQTNTAMTTTAPASNGGDTSTTITPYSTYTPAEPVSQPTTSSSSTASGTRGPKLTTAQIVGIAFGGTAAVVLAITVVCVTMIMRRRRFNNEKTGFYQMRDSWSPGRKGAGPHMLNISAPIHTEPQELEYHRPFGGPIVRPEAIGLAISPDGRKAQPVRSPKGPVVFPYGMVKPADAPVRADRAAQAGRAVQAAIAARSPQLAQAQTPVIPAMVSPRQAAQAVLVPPAQQGPQALPKPALTISIPQGQEKDTRPRTLTGRESVVTEFAEDGEADSAIIWRPPPSDPQSASTYYVADKWGNWVLGNPNRRSQMAELESPSLLTQTKSERAQEAMAASIGMAASNAKALPSRPAPARLAVTANSAQRSSSVYSNYSLPQSIAPGTDNPLPNPRPNPELYTALVRDGSIKNAKSRWKSKGADAPELRRRSLDSATTIESSQGGGPDEDPAEDEMGHNLSPVVESPNSAGGRSPVSYPRIPGRDRVSIAAPPPLKLFPASKAQQFSPPGQPSPTLGAVLPLKTRQPPGPSKMGGAQQLLGVPKLNPNPNRNPGQIKTGSPEMRGQAQQVQGDGQQLQRPVGLPRSPSPNAQRPVGLPRTPSPNAQRPIGLPRTPSPNAQRQQSPPQQQFQQQSQRQQQPQPQQSQAIVGNQGKTSTPPPTVLKANGSSLLAKRLGAERAAALAFGGETALTRPGKWKRQSNRAGVEGAGEGAALPATPGWLPKLTPTRRGEDLFLNVQ